MTDLLTDRFRHVALWTVELKVPGEGKVLTSYVGTYLEARAWAHGCGDVEVLAIRED